MATLLSGMTEQDRVLVQAYLDADPMVREMRERARHVYVYRDPPTGFDRAAPMDPVFCRLDCSFCLPVGYGSAPLDYVLKADGTLQCSNCRQTLIVLAEDLPDLAALAQAIKANDHDAYWSVLVRVNEKILVKWGYGEVGIGHG